MINFIQPKSPAIQDDLTDWVIKFAQDFSPGTDWEGGKICQQIKDQVNEVFNFVQGLIDVAKVIADTLTIGVFEAEE